MFLLIFSVFLGCDNSEDSAFEAAYEYSRPRMVTAKVYEGEVAQDLEVSLPYYVYGCHESCVLEKCEETCSDVTYQFSRYDGKLCDSTYLQTSECSLTASTYSLLIVWFE